MALIGPENAIGWAQFRLRGGWWKTLPLLLGYTAIIGISIVMSVQFNPRYRSSVLTGWSTGLMAIQASWLILLGGSRISAAIRQDIATRMLESHRMMPMPPSHAIAGYIVGGGSQGFLLFFATFLIGVFAATAAGVSFERWAASSLILLTFAMFLACISVMSGFLIKGAGGIVWFLLISPWFGEGGVLGVLPGLTVLLSPIIGRSIFELRATWTLEWTHAMALAAQAAVGAICFIGAMRKYRAEQTPLFGPALGLALLAAWVAVSFAGIRQWEEFRPRFLRIHINQGVQILSSILAGMLFALMPISAAAREHVQRRWRAMMHDPAPLRRAMPWWVLVFVATALIIAICIAPESQSAWSLDSVARTGIVIALALAGVYFLCRACYQFIGAASFIIGGWIFLTWVLPLLLDVGRYALSTDADAPPITRISSFGAAGALGLIWTGSGDKTTSGIMVQALIACAAVLFSIVAEKRSGQVR